MGARQLAKHLRKVSEPSVDYGGFEKLDGKHPWMENVPEGCVPYRVRELQTGEVAYFNFALAKEMGLLPLNHPHEMNDSLKSQILRTFSIQIINEYDELSKRKIDPKTIKPGQYMASRYLQLQHSNKQGKTSGDGRGIWNGTLSFRGKVWDVSSRGTGVTCLAPGAVMANRPLKTGETEFGYGCGQAEIDELYAAAISAEVIHLQGIQTERVLCVIDLGKGYGIGVRAAPNLIRPAHLFLYLKQNRWEQLKKATDYLIQRQVQNGRWKIKAKGPARYDEMLETITNSFAEFTAKLDIDYVFAWLDWDGDNVLADAGIIDYGSVRQFGIRHDQYRYDDVERFSTNLNEQRIKAKLIVQVFAQLVDFLKTKKKKTIKEFANAPAVTAFDVHFEHHRAHRLLYRMGFNPIQRNNILKHKQIFKDFDQAFSYLERVKVRGNKVKVPDGVNQPALFNIRKILQEFPDFLLQNSFETNMHEDEFFVTILSSFAKSKDSQIRAKHRGHIQNFQRLYKMLVEKAAGQQKPAAILKGISQRAKKLNRENRITGNALIQIVWEILEQIKKSKIKVADVQKIIDQLLMNYLDQPEVETPRGYERKPKLVVKPELLSKLMSFVQIHQEDI